MAKSKQNCAVPKCPSVRRNNPGLSFHRFPKDGESILFEDELVDRKRLWCFKLKMIKEVSKHMQVCSKHFTEADFECSGWSGQKRLRPTAVPSQNLSGTKKRKELVSSRRKISTKTVEASLALNLTDCNVQPIEQQQGCTSNTDVNDSVNYRDCAVQVGTGRLLTICNFVQTDKHLNTLTGLPSFFVLNTLVTTLDIMISNDKRVHRLTLYERVFLIFMKLKLNLPYSVLSVLFRVSKQTCQKIFFNNITLLAHMLKIKRNQPNVLDCTEISTQKHTTIKFMTGTSPAGLITYVSSPYYGSPVSDTAMFKQSNLLSRLSPGEAVMVDKGFLIDDVCTQFGIGLVRQKKLFSHDEGAACTRVHIERANQRIKSFRILNSRLPIDAVPVIEDIFNVICGIVNLSNPICHLTSV